MLNNIKSQLKTNLRLFLGNIDERSHIKKFSPEIYRSIKEYIQRDGKRLRPTLFIVGYEAYAKKPAKNLYLSAIAVELIHDFILIHDDIIDKANIRRGKASLNRQYNALFKNKNKTAGQDVALVVGDIIFALSISTYLSVDVNKTLKEKGLKKMMDTAVMTGEGQILELLNTFKKIHDVREKDVLKICDLKTALYSFCAPLEIGATLAGVKDVELKKLHQFGLSLGRAFQLKDDILGILGDEAKTGKSIRTDLQESKKTLLVLKAHQKSPKIQKTMIEKILAKRKISNVDLKRIGEIIKKTGSLDYALKKIRQLHRCALEALDTTAMNPGYKQSLQKYTNDLLIVKIR